MFIRIVKFCLSTSEVETCLRSGCPVMSVLVMPTPVTGRITDFCFIPLRYFKDLVDLCIVNVIAENKINGINVNPQAIGRDQYQNHEFFGLNEMAAKYSYKNSPHG